MWWWIEPICKTGLVLIVPALWTAFIAKDSESNIPGIVVLVLLLPLALSAISAVAWLFCSVFYQIWSPYI